MHSHSLPASLPACLPAMRHHMVGRLSPTPQAPPINEPSLKRPRPLFLSLVGFPHLPHPPSLPPPHTRLALLCDAHAHVLCFPRVLPKQKQHHCCCIALSSLIKTPTPEIFSHSVLRPVGLYDVARAMKEGFQSGQPQLGQVRLVQSCFLCPVSLWARSLVVR